jgi:hypothetical protein
MAPAGSCVMPHLHRNVLPRQGPEAISAGAAALAAQTWAAGICGPPPCAISSGLGPGASRSDVLASSREPGRGDRPPA